VIGGGTGSISDTTFSPVGRPRGNTLEAFIIAALIYWILTIIFSFFQERLERRMARGDR